MNKVKNILVLLSRIEILISVTGLGHGFPVCGFHTRPKWQVKVQPLLHSCTFGFPLIYIANA